MTRKLMLTACAVLVMTITFAQNESGIVLAPGERTLQFKPQNPAEDKNETISVTGTRAASFATSNTADGTANSFKHSLRVTIPLTTNSKNNDFQLVFYSANENIPYAVSQSGNVISLFFPMAVYESITQQLQSAVTARKPVQVKVTQKSTGYREASLVF
jgi:hypothetical protein